MVASALVSKYKIIGGKAVTVESSQPSITSKQKVIKPRSSSSDLNAVANANLIFQKQTEATRQQALKLEQQRQELLRIGATKDQAQILASRSSDLGKTGSKNASITAQTQDILFKSAQINKAQELIKEQTTKGSAGTIDNLAQQIKNVTVTPIKNISVASDTPRKNIINLENASLTGSKDISISNENKNVDPNVTLKIVQDAFESVQNKTGINAGDATLNGNKVDVSLTENLPKDVTTTLKTEIDNAMKNAGLEADIPNGTDFSLDHLIPDIIDPDSKENGTGNKTILLIAGLIIAAIIIFMVFLK